MQDFLTICERAARKGGEILLDWTGRFSVREKGPRDLVTEADLASQQAVRELLLGEFPEHAFLGEEDGTGAAAEGAKTAEHCWIVDPLDGTTNYAHGVPHYCVSVALQQRGELIAGCIFNPVLDECFTAAKDRGAFLNRQRLSVSDVDDPSHALVATGFSSNVQKDSPDIGQFVNALVATQALRRGGSAALNLAYLAAGRFDAYWAGNTKIWDVAAGIVLVREAGGVVTGLDGSAFRPENPHCLVAATSPLHQGMKDVLGVRL